MSRKENEQVPNETEEILEDDLTPEEATEEDTPSENGETEEMVQDEQDESLVLIEELKQQIAELEDRNLRTVAEFDNFRKRSRKEREQLREEVIADVIKTFLPVLDNLDRANDSVNEDSCEEAKSVAKGVEMVIAQAHDCLASLGVEEIETEGQDFDPRYHNAVQTVEDEEQPSNRIAEVILKGYKINENIVRHSIVVVVK